MFVLWLSIVAFWGTDCSLPFEEWRQNDSDVRTFIACLNDGDLGICPTAEAGLGQEVGVGNVVTLSASGSVGVGGGTPTFNWAQLDNGAPTVLLQNADSVTATFVASEIGNYQFEVTMVSGCRTATDQVSITVISDEVTFPQEVQLTEIANANTTVVEVVNAGDDRLFIVTKNGQVRIYDNGQILPTPFLDLSGVVATVSEQGLLGLAFDPDYATNGYLYAHYVGRDLNGNGDSRVTRIAAFEVSADPNVADFNSGNILLSIDQPAVNHNGGQIVFGPDGMLYLSLGDGGGQADQFGNGQNTDTLLATILRLGVDGPRNPYSIPSDNPFAQGPTGFLPEIWAYGLRNPWRISFDAVTGDLYIADVGQSAWEEVNVQAAGSSGGQNYGWPFKEGTNCFNPATNCDPGGLTDPVFEYSHSFGCSVTGGYVYRGQALPALDGFYIVTDFCESNYWLLKRDGQGIWQSQIVPFTVDGFAFDGNVTGFGQGSDRELYICTSAGQIFQITGVTP